MDMFRFDHIPTISIGYVAFMTLSAFLGIATSIYSRKLFIRLCVLVLLLQGISTVIIPSFSLPRSPKSIKFDALHSMLAQLVGCAHLFCGCILWLSTRTHHDSTPRVSIVWAWSVSLILKLLARAYMLRKIPANSSALFTEQEMCNNAALLHDLVWILLLLAHLVTTSSWGGYAGSASRINTHLRLEYLLLVVSGISEFAFPQWLIKDLSHLDRLDLHHVYLSQVHGGLLFVMGLMSGRVVHYISNSDKAVYLSLRSALMTSYLVITLYHCVTSPLLSTVTMYLHVAMLVVVIMNALAGWASVSFPSFVYRHGDKTE